MQLLKPVACRTAREKGDLYVVLAKEIDRARETYRRAIYDFAVNGRLPS